MGYWLPVVVFVLLVLPFGIILPFMLHPWWLSLFVISVVVSGGLFLIVRRQWREYTWMCKECGHVFERSERSVWVEFLSPHLPSPVSKLLKCPRCSGRSWCLQVKEKACKGVDIEFLKHPEPGSLASNNVFYVQVGVVVLAYLILWVCSLYMYPGLPELIPKHFDMSFTPDAWCDRSGFWLLPGIAIIFPVLHGLIIYVAVRQGYKSRVYPFLTVLFVFILLFFTVLQYLIRLEAPLYPGL